MLPPRTAPHLLTLILLTATATLSLNMFLPSLPGIARELRADYALVSLAVAGYLAITAVLLLIAGPLSDRVGRRPVLLGAVALFAAASLGCARAEDVWTFLAFRMLQGGIACGYTLSRAIVRDIHDQRSAASLIGYIGMAMAVAPMLGPMVGGVLDTVFGWRAIFWFYTVSGLGLLALCWIDLGETRPQRSGAGGNAAAGMPALLREPKFWAYALCTVFSRGAFYVFVAGTPLVAMATFGAPTAEIGVYVGSITAGFMVGAFLSARLAKSQTPVALMVAGRIIACIGLLLGLGLVAAGWTSPILYFGCTVFAGLGNGITTPSSSAASLSVRPDLAGSAAGLETALTVTGGALLTSLTGLALAYGAPATALLLLMLATSGAGLLAVLWAMRLER